MNALQFEHVGKPIEILRLKQTPKFLPQKGEILVKVLAAPINPNDYIFMEGTYRFKPTFPQTAGLEGCGIIEEVGEGVHLTLGSLVAFMGMGTWAEYTIVPAKDAFELPPSFPIERAAQFFLNPMTALGLLDVSKVEPGGYLLMNAGNSAMSQILAQLAIRKGIHPILVVRSAVIAADLKHLGAALMVYEKDKLPEQVLDITKGKGAQSALDSIGGDYGEAILSSLGPNGIYITMGRMLSRSINVNTDLLLYKGITLRGFGIRGWMAEKTNEQLRKLSGDLVPLIGDPDFHLPVAGEFTLQAYKEALHQNEQPGKPGKVIFMIAQS
jgi:NADPH2:quinone reductase